MMYKLLNKIFGWDYIHWRNSADSGIARVHADYTGQVYYWRYYSVDILDVVKDPSQVMWLTCPPSKYFKELEDN